MSMETDADTGAIAICALRYSIGRRTYMPSLVTDWVKRHWSSFSLNDRKVILRDLQREINNGRNLGDDCDVKTWLDFEKWILQQHKLKVGDEVKFCHSVKEASIAAIVGEHEDGVNPGKWIVDCPERGIFGVVFNKESLTHDGRYYNFGNMAFWITPYIK